MIRERTQGLWIEEVGLAALLELGEVGGPGGGDLARVFVVSEGLHGIDVGDEAGGFDEIEAGGVEVVEGGDKFESEFGRVEGVAISEG